MKIPKVYDKAYKEYEYKDYGVGRFQYIYRYCDTIAKDKKIVLYKALYTPAKMKKIEIEIASGLDSVIEEREVLKIFLINESLKDYDE
ncbi:hypothetical protein CQA53_09685 [Helicobacter didelphidarum]|uniref:Uncharacterized protein n=1 Tax=Helicobacter didelphidarum TaxID=2040648 RepID=A0A3D8IBL0_9HELI|nr:hypothetical protein [Helicobacter didelphidarum]RDU61941.1 hypothetical protein CQA53_09685 [Helicobacter didelphidarum]